MLSSQKSVLMTNAKSGYYHSINKGTGRLSSSKVSICPLSQSSSDSWLPHHYTEQLQERKDPRVLRAGASGGGGGFYTGSESQVQCTSFSPILSREILRLPETRSGAPVNHILPGLLTMSLQPLLPSGALSQALGIESFSYSPFSPPLPC